MTQVSLITFLFGAAAVSMQFWEGFWLMFVLSHSTRTAIERERARSSTAMKPPNALAEESKT
jgi:hypothetical protein